MESQDLYQTLLTHQAQLQQVEIALIEDPENEDFKKLKKDLEEVISLTQQLISSSDDPKSQSNVKWKAGDKCLAPWTDGQYHEARIQEVVDNHLCTIMFTDLKSLQVAQFSKLKPFINSKITNTEAPETKKLRYKAQKEYKRKKALKKALNLKEKEMLGEKQKESWQQFNAKFLSKSKKGVTKKSIFATPDSLNGRVGIGTCNIGGKPMTEYVVQDMVKKPCKSGFVPPS